MKRHVILPNENKLVELRFMKNYIFFIKGGGLNKYLHLKRGLIREGGFFERGKIEKIRYLSTNVTITAKKHHIKDPTRRVSQQENIRIF